MPDVLQGMKADIQSNPPFARRDADDRDGRYLRPSPGDFKNRSLSNGSPGLSDSRDKAKPALVEEDKGDVKPFGLFLYAAMNGVSTVLFPSHPARGLLSVVFDNSNPFRSGATRYYWNDKIPRTSSRSPGRFFGWSKDRFGIRSSSLLRRESGQGFSSGARLASRVVQGQVLDSSHPHRSWRILPSTSARNLPNNLFSRTLPTGSFLYPRVQRPVGVAVQALSGFHGVAWNQFIIFLLLLRNSIGVPGAAALFVPVNVSTFQWVILPSRFWRGWGAGRCRTGWLGRYDRQTTEGGWRRRWGRRILLSWVS